MSLYWSLGKERPEYRRLLKQCVLAKCLQILDTVETLFLFVTLFCVVPFIFYTPIRTFIAFQTEDAAVHHLQFTVFSWASVYSQVQECEEWEWIQDKDIHICTHKYTHTHTQTHTPTRLFACSRGICDCPQTSNTCLEILNKETFCQISDVS